MHAKSGLRVLLEWKINRPDSVITDVILLGVLDCNIEFDILRRNAGRRCGPRDCLAGCSLA